MKNDLKIALKILAPTFAIAVMIYVASIEDNCGESMVNVRRTTFKGIVKGKYIDESKKHAPMLILTDDSIYIRPHRWIYELAEPGDIVIKYTGETGVYLIQQGDTGIYYPECDGKTYRK